MTSPSGRAVALHACGYVAEVVEVGAGLRTLRRDGLDVVAGYPADEMPVGCRGQLLVPWPNRIEDGQYDFDGVGLQLPLTEPALRNAIHGLTRWLPWTLQDQSASRARWRHEVFPQPGYPFRLSLTAEHSLAADGLHVRVEAANLGASPAPYGFGFHPYLTVGRAIDACELTLPAARWCPTDDRGLPAEPRPVAAEHDFRSPRPVGSTRLDDPFTGLAHVDGETRATLRDPDTGRTAHVVGDGSIGWLQVFTGDTLGARAREAVAVEPMTCPPNAFRTGVDLIVLAPGESHVVEVAVG